MKNIRYIDKKDVENLIESKTSDDVIIFLSGPTSQKTPLSVLQTRDVIAVNGSAQYLLSHNIIPYIYVLTDVRFYINGVMIFINLAREVVIPS